MADATKELERLEAQLKRARKSHGEGSAGVQTARRDRAEAIAERRAAFEAKARGEQDAETLIATAERKLADAEQAEQTHSKAMAGADAAARQLEGEIRDLYRDRFAEFAEVADAASREAAEALAASVEQLEAPYRCWHEAARLWVPLCRANGLDGPAPWPLPSPGSLRSGLSPRPPQIRADGEIADRDPDEPPLGSVVTVRTTEGGEHEVEVGSKTWKRLRPKLGEGIEIVPT